MMGWIEVLSAVQLNYEVYGVILMPVETNL